MLLRSHAHIKPQRRAAMASQLAAQQRRMIRAGTVGDIATRLNRHQRKLHVTFQSLCSFPKGRNLVFLSGFALQAKAIPSVDIRTTHKASSMRFKLKKITFSIQHFHYLQHTINLTHAPNSPASTTIDCIRTETGSWINTV
jgi:hypothetical protein